jgi:hypothetical protein
MKKILFFVFLIALMFFVKNSSLAVASNTPQDTDTPTPTISKNNQLDQLRAKIASKVAELKLTEKRGIIGTVTESTGTQITVLDSKGDKRFVDIDELTKFSSPADKGFGISDIEKDDVLGILGIYNKQSKRILARDVNLITIPVFITGVVASINKDEYSLNVITDLQKESVIDIENVTRTFAYSNSDGLAKSGFSKISEKENIVVVGYQNKTDKNRVSATRVILFPEIPTNPAIDIAQQALEKGATIIPSTGSGKKLTPITR